MEANLSLLPAEFAGYLHVLFSADALAAGGLIEGILERSADFASELAVRLRERVYFETVPALASALARRLGYEATPSHLDEAYEQVMVILFRLLFVAYAEDKDLLPYRTNSHYADHSLKLRARRLTEDRRASRVDYDESATDLWDDVRQLWRAVDTGNSGWGVPAYDGGLFSHDADVSPSGADLATLQLTDAEFAPALSALLVDDGDEGYGPVDFRLLSVREFGTIYEGLLESNAGRGAGRSGGAQSPRAGAIRARQSQRARRGARRCGLPAQPVRRPKGHRELFHETVRCGASAGARSQAST